jgi:hypothetical protein
MSPDKNNDSSFTVLRKEETSSVWHLLARLPAPGGTGSAQAEEVVTR